MAKAHFSALWQTLKLRFRVARRAVLPFCGDITPVGRLYATVIRTHPREHQGIARFFHKLFGMPLVQSAREDLGLISTKVVTDAGVAYMSGAFQGTGNLVANFKYHGTGTGTTAESAAQTALITEVESRATGSQAAGASANIYHTVGTVTYASPHAITEHGIFSASTVGTLLDRSVFAAINVGAGDSIEFTYDLTLPSGS